jgi:hypothetical protein
MENDTLTTTATHDRGTSTLLGAAEPSSPWANVGGLLGNIGNLAGGVASAVEAFRGKTSTPATVTQQATASVAETAIPWKWIGLAALALIALVMLSRHR